MDKEEESTLDLIADIAALVLSENEGEAANALAILRRKAQQSETSGGSLKRIWRRFADRGSAEQDQQPDRDGAAFTTTEASEELIAKLRRDLASVRQSEQRLAATVGQLNVRVQRANSRFKFATFAGVAVAGALALTLALSGTVPPPPDASLASASGPTASPPISGVEQQTAQANTASRPVALPAAAAVPPAVQPAAPLPSARAVAEAAAPPSPTGAPAASEAPATASATSGGGEPAADAGETGVRTASGDLGATDHAEPEIGNLPPDYPTDAARRGEQGSVLLRIVVAPDGAVARVDVTKSSGFATLDRAATDRIALWRFRPATRNGKPVPEIVEQQVRFTSKS